MCLYSLQLIQDASTMLQRMEHRGAFSCDNNTGDGAGILTGIPHKFYAQILRYVPPDMRYLFYGVHTMKQDGAQSLTRFPFS